ncbi:MAG: hypothetical protein LBR15_09170 [Methanobrevibacter sp.]|nr:hypothetical protein [Candidatus Methanovirga australis]
MRGLISDGDKSYKSIADDLEVPHQLCTFHLMNNLMRELIKPINKLKRRTKTLTNKIEEIKDKLPFLKHTKTKKKNKENI